MTKPTGKGNGGAGVEEASSSATPFKYSKSNKKITLKRGGAVKGGARGGSFWVYEDGTKVPDEDKPTGKRAQRVQNNAALNAPAASPPMARQNVPEFTPSSSLTGKGKDQDKSTVHDNNNNRSTNTTSNQSSTEAPQMPATAAMSAPPAKKMKFNSSNGESSGSVSKKKEKAIPTGAMGTESNGPEPDLDVIGFRELVIENMGTRKYDKELYERNSAKAPVSQWPPMDTIIVEHRQKYAELHLECRLVAGSVDDFKKLLRDNGYGHLIRDHLPDDQRASPYEVEEAVENILYAKKTQLCEICAASGWKLTHQLTFKLDEKPGSKDEKEPEASGAGSKDGGGDEESGGQEPGGKGKGKDKGKGKAK